MRRTLNIAIVGYGIAGIVAAIRLRSLGHRITHFDRNNPPVSCGAGMLLHPPALHQLDQLGVMAEAITYGAPVERICARTVQGRLLMDFGYSDLVPGQFGLGIQRGTLHRLLTSADSGRANVVGGHSVTSVQPDAGYLVQENHACSGPFDLIVVADGAHSLLREQLFGPMRHDQPAESAALVGLLDDPDGFAADRLEQYFDSTRHVSVWPVGRDFSGGPHRCSIAINISRDEAKAFRDRGSWRRLVARHCPALRPLIKDSVENSSLHIFTYRDVELRQSCVGRVALIGDAAHSMSPQLGTGAQLAMEDAAMLASVIAEHENVCDALGAYMEVRTPQLHRYHRASRWLTPLFQSDNRTMAFLRDHLFVAAMKLPPMKRVAYALLSG